MDICDANSEAVPKFMVTTKPIPIISTKKSEVAVLQKDS